MLDGGATALDFGTDSMVALVEVTEAPRGTDLDRVTAWVLAVGADVNHLPAKSPLKLGEDVANVLGLLQTFSSHHSLGRGGGGSQERLTMAIPETGHAPDE